MNHLINQLMTVDKAFYRHYLEMLLTLNRIQALTRSEEHTSELQSHA